MGGTREIALILLEMRFVAGEAYVGIESAIKSEFSKWHACFVANLVHGEE